MKNKVHLICNAHLDPVWQWRWTEGCSEAMATFRNAVEIIDEYPELIFNHNEAILYQWVEQYDPALFTRIGDLIQQGRWFISGGWYLQPDVNLLPLENLVKHITTGKEFFKSRFGVEPVVAYNFDSFGHPSTLPGILRDHGYRMYIHQRPEKDFLKLPDNLYLWKGFNGASIPAYRIEIGLYHTERKNITQRLTEAAELALKLNRDVALFWGLGNHGGGATRIDLDHIRAFVASESRVDIAHSTTDRFYEAIEKLIPSIPVYEGSLQRIFTGCYTSLARIKRKALEASYAAQQADALIQQYQAPGDPGSKPGMTRRGGPECPPVFPATGYWPDILFNDFHDILPGTCTEPAEQDALELYGRAMENIRRTNMLSIARINQASPALKSHIPVSVFQSDPELTSFPVEFECMSDYRPFWDGDRNLDLFDAFGKRIECQEEQAEARLPFFRWRRKVVFMARDWGAGVRHLRLEPGEETSGEKGKVQRFKSEMNLFRMRFLVVRDEADSWGTDHFAWDEVIGEFIQTALANVVEEGPVRSVRESLFEFHNSQIVLHEITYRDWPVTEYRARIRWNEEQCRLKWALETGLQNPVIRAEVPGGWEEFKADGQEYVHGTWMELTGKAKGNRQKGKGKEEEREEEEKEEIRCLGIAHNGMHGFDARGSELRFSVLRSAAYCHEQGYNLKNGRDHKFMDLGVHEVRMAVMRIGGHFGHEAGGHFGHEAGGHFGEGTGGHFGHEAGGHFGPPLRAVGRWLNAPPLVWPHLPVGPA